MEHIKEFSPNDNGQFWSYKSANQAMHQFILDRSGVLSVKLLHT